MYMYCSAFPLTITSSPFSPAIRFTSNSTTSHRGLPYRQPHSLFFVLCLGVTVHSFFRRRRGGFSTSRSFIHYCRTAAIPPQPKERSTARLCCCSTSTRLISHPLRQENYPPNNPSKRKPHEYIDPIVWKEEDIAV
jgi:hypothetical protein